MDCSPTVVRWTVEEEQQLILSIASNRSTNGKIMWKRVADDMPGRTIKALIHRKQHIDDDAKLTPDTANQFVNHAVDQPHVNDTRRDRSSGRSANQSPTDHFTTIVGPTLTPDETLIAQILSQMCSDTKQSGGDHSTPSMSHESSYDNESTSQLSPAQIYDSAVTSLRSLSRCTMSDGSPTEDEHEEELDHSTTQATHQSHEHQYADSENEDSSVNLSGESDGDYQSTSRVRGDTSGVRRPHPSGHNRAGSSLRRAHPGVASRGHGKMWAAEEDDLLISMLAKHRDSAGRILWKEFMHLFPERSFDSLSSRMRTLRVRSGKPSSARAARAQGVDSPTAVAVSNYSEDAVDGQPDWDEHDDAQLVEAVTMYRNENGTIGWTQFARKLFPGHSMDSIKHRWHSRLKLQVDESDDDVMHDGPVKRQRPSDDEASVTPDAPQVAVHKRVRIEPMAAPVYQVTQSVSQVANAEWSNEDDMRLQAACTVHRDHGRVDWQEVGRNFPHRSLQSLEHRWKAMQHENQKMFNQSLNQSVNQSFIQSSRSVSNRSGSHRDTRVHAEPPMHMPFNQPTTMQLMNQSVNQLNHSATSSTLPHHYWKIPLLQTKATSKASSAASSVNGELNDGMMMRSPMSSPDGRSNRESKPWSAEDDQLLIRAVDGVGNRTTRGLTSWHFASTLFPDRSLRSVQYRYQRLKLNQSSNHSVNSGHSDEYKQHHDGSPRQMQSAYQANQAYGNMPMQLQGSPPQPMHANMMYMGHNMVDQSMFNTPYYPAIVTQRPPDTYNPLHWVPDASMTVVATPMRR